MFPEELLGKLYAAFLKADFNIQSNVERQNEAWLFRRYIFLARDFPNDITLDIELNEELYEQGFLIDDGGGQVRFAQNVLDIINDEGRLTYFINQEKKYKKKAA